MKEKLKNGNKGITLIALIITIIVMLILVVTAVSVTINSGLFEKAGEATREWKANEEAEQELANGQVTINNKAYNNIDEYVEETQEKKITFYILHNFDTLEYTVAEGTTWEEFLSENQVPYFTEEGVTYYLPFTTNIDESVNIAGWPDGLLYLKAAGPVVEYGVNYLEGPWVTPDDPIKDGVTYDCQM